MERVLAFLIGLLIVANAAVVGVHYLDDNTDLVSDRNPVSDGRPEQVQVVPNEGQAFVTGTATEIAAEAAQVQPLKAPFTITPVERGVGRASIEKALIGGQRVTITWDGGTPLPVSGSGELILGSARVVVRGDGATYSLDGAVRSFMAGTYTLGATVAVGTTGIGTPRDGVSFEADDQTVYVPQGATVVRTGPEKLDLLGPGKLSLSGAFEVQFPARSEAAGAVSFGGGPYRITVQPGPSGLAVDAILQGSVDLRRTPAPVR